MEKQKGGNIMKQKWSFIYPGSDLPMGKRNAIISKLAELGFEGVAYQGNGNHYFDSTVELRRGLKIDGREFKKLGLDMLDAIVD